MKNCYEKNTIFLANNCNIENVVIDSYGRVYEYNMKQYQKEKFLHIFIIHYGNLSLFICL